MDLEVLEAQDGIPDQNLRMNIESSDTLPFKSKDLNNACSSFRITPLNRNSLLACSAFSASTLSRSFSLSSSFCLSNFDWVRDPTLDIRDPIPIRDPMFDPIRDPTAIRDPI